MEGSEAGGAERDGGVHHPQQKRHHRTHLPRGGSYGQYCKRVKLIHNKVNRETIGAFSFHPVGTVGFILGKVLKGTCEHLL